MLTNSTEYEKLKMRIARYLNIDGDNIHSIVNPMRNKKLPYHLVTLFDARFRVVLLRDTKSGFLVVN